MADTEEEDAGAPTARRMPLATPALDPSRRRVFIDTQHGLGNRMRALGSAASIARETDRELVVVWQPDDHCDCEFTDLFEYDGPVINEPFVQDAAALGCDVYNYMEIEDGAEKNAPIEISADKDTYLRAAFVFNSPHSQWESDNRFLQRLRPVEEVRDMLASVRNPNAVSAHVRMQGGKDFEHLPFESLDNWTEDAHEAIAFWREKSHFSHFLKRIDTLIEEGRADTIFLAADVPETYAEFKAYYGDRVAMLERSTYDRSAEQLKYALADAILLSRAPLLLGSNWSSFTEFAIRMSPGEVVSEMSGVDF
jgi:hypothetical protein